MRISLASHVQGDVVGYDAPDPNFDHGLPNLMKRAPGDPDEPAVAFALLKDAQSCEPTNVLWYYAGNFPDDAACDIIITNVNVPQTAPPPVPSVSATQALRRDAGNFKLLGRQTDGFVPITATLVHGADIQTANHSAWVPELAVPSGWYQLAGKNTDPASVTIYFSSSYFFVASGSDNSCLPAGTTPPNDGNNHDGSSTTTPQSESGGPGQTLVAPPISSPAGVESPPDGLESSGPSRASMIAGAVCGIIAVLLLLVAFLVWRFIRARRRRYANVDASAPTRPPHISGWRRSHDDSVVSKPKRKPPPAVVVDDFDAAFKPQPWTQIPALTHEPPAKSRATTPGALSVISPPSISSTVATENASLPSQHVHFAIPTIVAVHGDDVSSESGDDHPTGATSRISMVPSGDSDITRSSFADEREQLQETFLVPVTPNIIRDGVMSRTSSVGSDRNIGPIIFTPSLITGVDSESPMAEAQAQFVMVPVPSPRLMVPSPAVTARSVRSSRATTPIRSSGPTRMSPAFIMQVSSRHV